MEPRDLKLGKPIRRVTLVRIEPSGAVNTTQLYTQRGRKRRQSAALRPMERLTRRMARALADGAQLYVNLHDQSNRKKRNGWSRDILRNTARTRRRMWRTLTKGSGMEDYM
jgi:hypothetical protein